MTRANQTRCLVAVAVASKQMKCVTKRCSLPNAKIIIVIGRPAKKKLIPSWAGYVALLWIWYIFLLLVMPIPCNLILPFFYRSCLNFSFTLEQEQVHHSLTTRAHIHIDSNTHRHFPPAPRKNKKKNSSSTSIELVWVWCVDAPSAAYAHLLVISI